MTPQPSARTLRMTRQRRVILEAVKRAVNHPSADEVYRVVRRELPRISLGTVYRTLAVLSEVGLVHELQLGGKAKRFDGDLGRHYHVRCSQCGEIADVPFEPDRPLDEGARRLTDFKVTGHHLEFLGICPDCRATVAEEGTGHQRNRLDRRAGECDTQA